MRNLSVSQSPACCVSGAPVLAAAVAESLAAGFKALADPTRIAIVNRLAALGEVCVCDITGAFDLGQPTISHHLKVLRDAGLVSAEKRGKWAYYRIVPGELERLGRALRPDGLAAAVAV